MAEIRTLKLNLLADVDNFSRGLKTAESKTNGFSKNVLRVSKIAAGAFAAVGGAAIAMGISAAKAAAEDEASTKKYEKALKNTTKATDKQIKESEKWIQQQQFQYGFSDSKLRPAIERLTRSTKDITKAEKLASLAMDISAGTGKDLETVSMALGKAYDGNFGALKKLGVPLDANTIKTKDFKAATKQLSDTFSGQAQTAADTFQGKLQIVKEKLGELNEQVGQWLLPIISRFADYVSTTLLPILQKVADGFSGKPNSISNKVKQLGRDMGYGDQSGAYNLGRALRDVADSFGQLFDAFTGSGPSNTNSKLQSIADSLVSVANGINAVADAYTKGGKFIDKLTGGNRLMAIPILGTYLSTRGKRALGGPVTAGGSYLVGERGPEIFTPRSSGSIAANGAGGNTFVFNGVVDGESARRSIERLFQTSSRISGAPNFTGAMS